MVIYPAVGDVTVPEPDGVILKFDPVEIPEGFDEKSMRAYPATSSCVQSACAPDEIYKAVQITAAVDPRKESAYIRTLGDCKKPNIETHYEIKE